MYNNGLPPFNKLEKIDSSDGTSKLIQLSEKIKIYVNNIGELHRTDGPAYIDNSFNNNLREYFINGNRHRIDGPAIEDLNNPSKNSFWFNGKEFKTKEEFYNKIKKYKKQILFNN